MRTHASHCEREIEEIHRRAGEGSEMGWAWAKERLGAGRMEGESTRKDN